MRNFRDGPQWGGVVVQRHSSHQEMICRIRTARVPFTWYVRAIHPGGVILTVGYRPESPR